MKKSMTQLAFLMLVLSFVCCRNSQAEIEETEIVVKKIDSVESHVEATQKTLNQTSQALSDALEDLESI